MQRREGKEVSEEIIKQASEMAGPNNNFLLALQWGEDYRMAGLTPVYYTDEEEKMIFVTTEEKMNGTKFH